VGHIGGVKGHIGGVKGHIVGELAEMVVEAKCPLFGTSVDRN